MGYRSDVSVVFYTRKPDEVPFAAIKFWFDENYPRKEAVEEWEADIETGDTWVLVTYTAVKWYNDYEHVQAVRRAFDSFDECFEATDHDRTAWEIVEVGEEIDDTRHTNSEWADYRLWVQRSITFN